MIKLYSFQAKIFGIYKDVMIEASTILDAKRKMERLGFDHFVFTRIKIIEPCSTNKE